MRKTLLPLLLLLALASCQEGGKDEKKASPQPVEVVVHAAAGPGTLHPINSNTAAAFSINGQIFYALTGMDFRTLQLVPVLVTERARIESIADGSLKGGLKLTYELRPEAAWADGRPLTAEDVRFSLKCLKNPLLHNETLRLAYGDLDSFVADGGNKRRFSILTRNSSVRAEAEAGGFLIIPKHIYDPQGVMDKFGVHQLGDPAQEKYITGHARLRAYSEMLNGDSLGRDPKYLQGAGPYTLESWQAGQKIRLKKVKNWWGNKLSATNTFFEANPDYLTYRVINDPAGAITALKAQKLDVMSQIPPNDFQELRKNTRFLQNYHLYTPDEYGFTCITLNLKNPKLSDVRVRKALTHLLNPEYIVNDIMQGTASQTISMESPANKKTYNTDIKPLPYDPAKAKALLTEAGWKDADGDGILEKIINGKKTPLQFELLLNSGNPAREKIARLFQEEARKIGIQIEIMTKELMQVIQAQGEHQFEMAFNGWVSSPLPYDPKQIWHTEGIQDGNNFMQWGTPATDALIDSIRTELNEEKRIALFKRFQKVVYDDMPVLYLYAYKGRLAIHRKWDNAYPSSLRPGYNEAGFRGNEE